MNNFEQLLGITASALGVLHPAFQIVEQMANTYKAIKFAKGRCKAVIRRAVIIIKGVHDSAQSTGIDIQSSHLNELQRKLEDVQAIMQKLADMSFFKALLRFDMISEEVETADQHLTDCLQIFQIDLLFRARAEKESAAKADRVALQDILKELKGNYTKIRRRFAINTNEEEDQAMVAMERKLSQVDKTSQDAVETQIIKSSLECIKSSTGKSTPKQSTWLITEYELDFGDEIGGGGFSTVRRAKFRGTMVAVKVLKGVRNSREVLEREIDIWSRLRHDNVVPFYGASTLTSNPYIVCRYMRNGNLVRYLSRNPTVNRTKLIYEISLAMFYLHGEKIVHGDLKGVNVLVDDAGKACLTDFGLSSINSPVNPGATTHKISGTLRFLAPEALKGQPLNTATDVYAFGILIYEVFTGEVPFIGVPDDVLREGNPTLTRPASNQVFARGLTDDIWQMALDATSRNPSARPPFATIAKRLEPTEEELFSQTFKLANMQISGNEHETSWGHGPTINSSTTLNHSRTPLIQKAHSLEKSKPNLNSGPSPVLDFNSDKPICVELTCKYLNIEFGLVKSREPGVHIEENDSLHWQPISGQKGTLLREEANRFTYSRTIGEGINSWELDDNRVVLHSLSVNAECCFRDVQTARNWFDLQLSYARDGHVTAWGSSKVNGDWITRTQTWRRVVGGKLQMAHPVEGAPNLTPSSWNKVDLPKRYTIDSSDMDSVVCIVNPGSQRSTKCRWSVQGCTVTSTTYRSNVDQTPTLIREETYPSEGEARVIFHTMKAILEKGSDKKKH